MNTFKDWINQKYIDYLQDHGEHRTITEFAEHIGVHQTTISAWMNGTRFPGRQKTIEILVSTFGEEVYQYIGKESVNFNYSPLSEAPPSVRRKLSAAISDANQQYREAAARGKAISDEEAEHILCEAMSKYGFFDNDTDTSN